MKALIIICVVVLLLQLAALGVSLRRGEGEQGPAAKDIESGSWKPPKPSLAATFNDLLDPFRPRVALPWDKKALPAGVAETVTFAKDAPDKRLGKFELAAGGGVTVSYACGATAAKDCQARTICLCAAGAVDAITVYAGGTLTFTGMTPAGGTVRQR